MRFVDAKKLHKGDEVIHKYTKAVLYVVETKIDGTDIYIYANDGNWYHHRTLK